MALRVVVIHDHKCSYHENDYNIGYHGHMCSYHKHDYFNGMLDTMAISVVIMRMTTITECWMPWP